MFGYNLEDTDFPGGEPIFTGVAQYSVLWNNIRDAFSIEIMQMMQQLRSGGLFSYNIVEQRYENHQRIWPEAVWNEDSYVKYIEPLVDVWRVFKPSFQQTAFYLPMLQGSKEEQRKWWLSNRFQYMDSKWNTGDARSVITLRAYAKSDITVTPYADIYPMVKYGSYTVQERGTHGQPTTLVCPVDDLGDTEVYIYSASALASVGDLSGLKVGYADFAPATRLQDIKIGDSSVSYENALLLDLHLGNNILLETIDARNCVNLGGSRNIEGTVVNSTTPTIDLSGCVRVKNIYFDNTKIKGVNLPDGGLVEVLHLPETITNLSLINLKNLSDLTVPSYENVTTLRIENCSNAIDPLEILEDVPANSRVRIIGFDITAQSAAEIDEFYDYLETMRGLDENGNTVDTAQVSGTIHIESLTGAEIAGFQERFPYITIAAEHTTSYRYFKTWDGSALVTNGTVECIDGVPQASAPSVPSRSSTAQYTYTAVGWSSNQDAQTANYNHNAVTMGDTTYYAAYSRTVRSYTIRFVRAAADGGGTLQTRTLTYGTMASYTGSTPTTTQGSATDYPFEGWTPTLATVTGAATYTAKFGSPVQVYRTIDSWETIIGRIDNGSYKDIYKIGAYKELDLGSTEGKFDMQIAAFDTDIDENGNTVPVTFISMNLSKNRYEWGQSYDWGSCGTRSLLNSTVKNAIPSKVKDRIINVKKPYKYIDNGDHYITPGSVENSYDYIWMPSAQEVNWSDTAYSRLRETAGVTYTSLFYEKSNRIKTKDDVAYGWNTRETYYNGFHRGIGINASGEYVSDVNYATYPCIGFCIGKDTTETITDSWETIMSRVNPSQYYSIGDTKILDLGNEGKLMMEIVAFDTDDKADGSGKAKITWISKNVTSISRPYNNSQKTYNGITGSCAGGWYRSDLRTYLRGDLYSLIPQSIRNAIVNVNKQSTIPNSEAWKPDFETQVENIWIPSYYEMHNYDRVDGETGYYYSGASNRRYFISGRTLSRTLYMNNYAVSLGSGTVNNGYAMIGFCTDPIETITDSWDTILSRSDPSQYYNIGDTKQIDLGSEGKHSMEIVAFNADDKADGTGKAKITWISKDLLYSKKTIRPYSSGNQSWEYSELRKWLREELYPTIDSTIRSNIVEVNKISYYINSNSDATSVDTVWIPSVREVGSNSGTREDSGVTYSSISSVGRRIRCYKGQEAAWWTRTNSTASSSGYYQRVLADGSFTYGLTNSEQGVLLGFCTD